MTSLKKSVY